MDRHRLRTTFEEVPELYDRARPVYPPQIFDDLVALAGLSEDGRIVEIGCGTGQATLPLAERGFEIVCVELGAGLAAIARQKLGPFPKVEIVNALFETWEPSVGGFDAVVAFTAFHWIDPEVRFAKVARMLGEGGALAVVATQHVLTENGDRFWTDVQEDYVISLARELGERARVLRLVKADLAHAGDLEPRHEPVPLIRDRRHELDPLSLELLDRPLDVVAHEEQLVISDRSPPSRPRMDAELARRQREDEPALARVDAREIQHVPEEGASRLGVLGVDQGVSPRDHGGNAMP
jgi:SAM-dependent methyltransferase